MARSRQVYPDPQPLAFGRRTSVGNGLLTQFLEADMASWPDATRRTPGAIAGST